MDTWVGRLIAFAVGSLLAGIVLYVVLPALRGGSPAAPAAGWRGSAPAVAPYQVIGVRHEDYDGARRPFRVDVLFQVSGPPRQTGKVNVADGPGWHDRMDAAILAEIKRWETGGAAGDTAPVPTKGGGTP
jgi:hypothetical protein